MYIVYDLDKLQIQNIISKFITKNFDRKWFWEEGCFNKIFILKLGGLEGKDDYSFLYNIAYH